MPARPAAPSLIVVVLACALAMLSVAPAHAGFVKTDFASGFTAGGVAEHEVKVLPPGPFGTILDTLVAVQLDRRPVATGTAAGAAEEAVIRTRTGTTYGTALTGSPFVYPPDTYGSGRTYDVFREQLHVKANPSTASPKGAGLIFLQNNNDSPWVATATGTSEGKTGWGALFPNGAYNAGASIEKTTTPSMDNYGSGPLVGHEGREIVTRTTVESGIDEKENAIGNRCSGNGLCVTSGYVSLNFGLFTFKRISNATTAEGHVCQDKPGGVLVAQIDGLGPQDIVNFGSGCGSEAGHYGFEVWINNGTNPAPATLNDDGQWRHQPFRRTSGGNPPMGVLRDVAVGNLNADGQSEIVTLSANGFEVWRWNSAGTAGSIGSARRVPYKKLDGTMSSDGATGMQVLVDDMAVDPSPIADPNEVKNDVVVVRTDDTKAITVFPNTGSGGDVEFFGSSVAEGQHIPASFQSSDSKLKTGTDAAPDYWPGRRAVSADDLDGNGRRDLIAYDGNGTFTSYLQTKRPTLTATVFDRPVQSTQRVESGKAIPLKAIVAGAPTDISGVTYEWDLDEVLTGGADGTGYEVSTGTSPNTTITVAEDEVRTVRVRARNATGDVARYVFDVRGGAPLSAKFFANPPNPEPDDDVTFTATPTGGFEPHTYQWSVDGAPVEGATGKTFVYGPENDTPGRHAFAVVVRDAEGHTVDAAPQGGAGSVVWSAPVDARLVAGRAPLVRPLESSQQVTATTQEPVTVSAETTRGGIGPYTYSFDLDGDGPGGFDEPTAEAVRTRTFAAASGATPYVVRVRVRDSEAVTDDAAVDVHVLAPLSPRMSASNREPEPGQTVTFDAASATSGGEGPYTYAWTVDGSAVTAGTPEDATPTDGLLTVRFNEQRASVPVTVTVTDKRGRTHSPPVSETVRVAEPVVHRIVATPAQPDVDELVNFSAATTTGGLRLPGSPLRYEFDLDDNGTFERDTGTDPTVGPRRFTSAGAHVIRVRTTESDGRRTTGSLTLIVSDPLAPAITQTPEPARPGNAVTFDAATVDPGGVGPYTFRWALARGVRDGEEPRYVTVAGETGRAYTPSPALTAGKYSVRAQLTDARGRTAETTHDFKVANVLVAAIEASNTFPQVGEEVTFTSKTAGGLTPYAIYDWDLDGDGETDESAGHGPTAKTTYTEALDDVDVRLEVTDADGEVDATVLTLDVSEALSARFTFTPAQPGVGENVVFDAATSRGGDAPYAKYEWFFDGSTTPEAQTTRTLTRSFGVGRHSAVLQVTDKQGRTSKTAAQSFKVANPLVAAITLSNQSPQAGEELTLDAAPTTGGLPPYATYDWDVDGDGTYDEAAGHAATAKTSFATAGDDHEVGLRVTDADGVTDTVTVPVIVDGALSARFVRTPSAPRVGEEVTFDGSTTGGGATPYKSYEWYLDGADEPESETGPVLKTTFAAGRHTARLTVTDAQDRTSTATEQSFKVADPLVAAIGLSNDLPQVGEEVTLDAAPTTGGLSPYKTYDWDLDGDGTFDESAGHGSTAKTTFATAGEDHEVGLRVTDGDDVTDTATLPVRVTPRLTAAFTRTPGRAAIGETITFDGRSSSGGETPYKSYEWFLDGSETPEALTTATLEHAFSEAGRHTAELRVTDAQDRTSTAASQSFAVANDLQATLTASPAKPERDQETTFDASGVTGGLGPFRYAFDLDDDEATGPGGFETGPQDEATAKRSFPTAGVRTVRVRVTDESDQTSIARIDVRVVEPLAAVATSSPASPRPGNEVTLSAADTTGGATPYTYAWTIDGVDAGTDATIRRTYADPGYHTASLTVTDSRGVQSTSLESFKVANPLVATLAADPTRPQTGEAVRLTAGQAGGVGPFTYAYDLDGDGTFSEPGDAATSVTYETPGDRRPVVRVTDRDGTEAVTGVPLSVVPALTAKLESRPVFLAPGGEATISAAATAGGAGDRTFRWDVDGQPGFELDTGKEPFTKRTFPDKGRFEVSVEVEDEAGHTSTATMVIDVGDKLRAALKAGNAAPESGETVTVTATASPDVGPKTYRFDLDGEPGFETVPSADPVATFTAGKTGTYFLAVEVTDQAGQVVVGRTLVNVAEKLVPAFSSRPTAPEMGEEVEFRATPTKGGTAPRRYAWDLDGDGTFERKDSDEVIAVTTFETLGDKQVALRVTDLEGRIRTVKKTLKVIDGCRRSVRVNLAFVETVDPDGCFRRGGTRKEPTYWTTDDVELNHLRLRLPSGTRLTVRMPTEDNPGGRLTADQGEVRILGEKLFDAKINWTLPDDPTDGNDAAERQIFGGGGVAGEAKLMGLKVEGAFRLLMGRDEGVDGAPPEHYVKLRVDAAIPSVKLGPYTDSPGATARLSLRHDRSGTHPEAAYVQLENAFLPAVGGVEVENVCLSYRAAGYLSAEDAAEESADDGDEIKVQDDTLVPIKGCAMFDDNIGEAFLKCTVDPTVDNWNGTLELNLFKDYGFAASVGIAGNRLSNMAIKGVFGDKLPIVKPVAYFRSLAAGVCLEPAPLQVRGEGVIGGMPIPEPIDEDLISVGGGFYYTGADAGGPSASDDKPWRAELQGNATFLGLPVGKGHLGIDGDYVIDVKVEPKLKFPRAGGEVVKLDGKFDGFIETRTGRFNVEGESPTICIATYLCRTGDLEALLSSEGAAACYTLLRIPKILFIPAYDFKVGFGSRWGGAPDVMVESCGVGSWRVVRSARARAAQAGGPVGRTIDVGPNDPVLIMRARGEKAFPRVRLTDPDGNVVFTSPEKVLAAEEPGKWMYFANEKEKATQLIVAAPKPGRWTVTPIADEPIVGLDSAEAIPPATLEATATKTGARAVDLDYQYVPQADTEIEFFEMDPVGKSTMRTLGRVKPGDCAKAAPAKPGVPERKCGRISFEPTYGPGGKRKVVATISRFGKPVENRDVATYVAPPPLKAGRVRGLSIVRGRKGITITHRGSPGSAEYKLAAVVDRGDRRLVTQRRGRRVRLPQIPKGSGVLVEISGFDALGMPGPRVRLRLPPNARRAGAKPRKTTTKRTR